MNAYKIIALKVPSRFTGKRIAVWSGLSALVMMIGTEAFNSLTLGRYVPLTHAVPALPDWRPSFFEVRLPIADRPHAPNAPADGWCGEASIQMGCLHYGLFISQKEINRLGINGRHGMWAYHLPVALDKLSMTHYDYSQVFSHIPTTAIQRLWRPKGFGVESFIDWQRCNLLSAHRPIISGILMSPNDVMPITGCFGPFCFDRWVYRRYHHLQSKFTSYRNAYPIDRVIN